MNTEELRKRHKELLDEWHQIKERLDPLEKICMAKELKPGEKIEPISFEVLDEWYGLVKQEERIFDEIRKLYQDYYRQKND